MGDNSLQAVTLKVLMSTTSQRNEGVIELPNERGFTLANVRVVRLTELPALCGEDKSLYVLIADLAKAIDSGEKRLLESAVRASLEWYRTGTGIKDSVDFDAPLNELKRLARLQRAYLANVGMKRCRLVMWAPKNGGQPLVPAIYCPDHASARFALQAADPRSRRKCAGCGQMFIPTSARQEFHTAACGTADRVRRKRLRDA